MSKINSVWASVIPHGVKESSSPALCGWHRASPVNWNYDKTYKYDKIVQGFVLCFIHIIIYTHFDLIRYNDKKNYL